MPDWSSPSKAVKEARRTLGLSAADFAAEIGLGGDGGRTVRRWEAGDFEPSGPTKLAIEHLLYLHTVTAAQVSAALRSTEDNAIASAVGRAIERYTNILNQQVEAAGGWPDEIRLPMPKCPIDEAGLLLFAETIADDQKRRAVMAVSTSKKAH